MDIKAFLSELDTRKIEYVLNEPMCNHTTFKIGGNADAFINVYTAEELSFVLRTAAQCFVPVFLLGKGSNLLVSDNGIEGAVVYLKGMDEISVEENRLIVGGGASLRTVCIAAQKAGLSGLEFAFGIPGTVGGAVFMNAGAYGGEISQVIKRATVMDKNGELRVVEACDMALGYRTSIFKTSGDIVLSAEFELVRDDKNLIRERMDDYFTRRREKQPLEYPSAGSTFKRPEGYFAGKLIQDAGLRGFQVGGAEVSEKHCGFVINKDQATAADIQELMRQVSDKVMQEFGVKLEPEVKTLGEF